MTPRESAHSQIDVLGDIRYQAEPKHPLVCQVGVGRTRRDDASAPPVLVSV